MPLLGSPIVLWANSTTNALHEDWQSTGVISALRFTQGDTVNVELHWLKNVLQTNLIHDEVEWPAMANITLALGLLDAPPTAGSFKLAYDGDETISIPADASAQDVEDALNGLPSIASEGGVTVSKVATSYRIIWNEACVPVSTISTYSNDLTPNSTIGIGVIRAGSASVSAIYSVHIKQAPVALCTTWEDAEQAVATISLESTVQDLRTWVLEFSRLPRSGTFTLSYVTSTGGTGTSKPIDVTALADSNFSKAFTELSGWPVTWWVTATKRSPLVWAIGIESSDSTVVLPVIASLAVSNPNLVSFQAKNGILSLNTADVETLLAGASSKTVVLEVEVAVDNARQTLVQADAVIVNDLIDTDGYDLVTYGELFPADSVVRYDTSQTLFAGQKTQARTNIGALGQSDLVPLNNRDDQLELLITSQNLTTDELGAIHGSDAPSAINVMLTQSGADALYAALVHNHAIADVTGLQTQLDDLNVSMAAAVADVAAIASSKADIYHTQAKSTITGLEAQLSDIETALDGFAPLVHTHEIADVTGLSATLATLTTKTTYVLTQAEKEGLDAGTSPATLNPFMTLSQVNSRISAELALLDYATMTDVGTAVAAAINPIASELTALTTDVDTNCAKYDSLTATPFNGPLHTADYPQELSVTINGTTYKLPCRL